eukprot:6265358-Ditylum_brightwellii.AAC.1
MHTNQDKSAQVSHTMDHQAFLEMMQVPSHQLHTDTFSCGIHWKATQQAVIHTGPTCFVDPVHNFYKDTHPSNQLLSMHRCKDNRISSQGSHQVFLLLIKHKPNQER